MTQDRTTLLAVADNGLWLEGTAAAGEAASGVWLQTAAGGGFAFTVATRDPANMTFHLGAAAAAAAANSSWVAANRSAGGPLMIDRALQVPTGAGGIRSRTPTRQQVPTGRAAPTKQHGSSTTKDCG